MSGHLHGVYSIPEAEYFADPALSCSGAKLLLPPNCPALYRYRQDNPEPYKRAWEYGTAAHRLALGRGADFAVIDADNYLTKKAKEARDEARAAGAAPVLTREYEQILWMAAAIRAHPLAGPLLDPGRGGRAEQSLFWTDEETGVPRRCRIDQLPEPGWGRYIVTDYKSCVSADPDAITKAIARYGYYQQDPYYLDGVRALGLDGDPAFLFVFQEKTPPYLVNVAQLEPEDRELGRRRNARAIEIYRDCTTSGLWPGYEAATGDGITHISLPPWTARTLEAAS